MTKYLQRVEWEKEKGGERSDGKHGVKVTRQRKEEEGMEGSVREK